MGVLSNHHVYRRRTVVITTTNNDTFTGEVVWTTRREITLRKVAQVDGGGLHPLDGELTITAHAIAWIQRPETTVGGE